MKPSNPWAAVRGLHWCAILSLLVCATSTTAQAQPGAANESVAAPAGLIGWWRGGDDARDAVTKEAAAADTASYVDGKVGRAFNFANAATTVRIPAGEKRNDETRNGFTLELWVNPRDTESGQPLVEFRSDQNVGVHLWIYDAVGRIWGNIRDTAGADHGIASGAGVMLPNVWQHVALVYDRAGVSSMYRNGALVARSDIGSFSPQMGYQLYLGGHRPDDPDTRFCRAALDEVSLYNRPLSNDEIAAIYLAGAAGKSPSGQRAPASPAGSAKVTEDLSAMVEPFVERSPEVTERAKVWENVRALFKDKQYDKIEQLAADYRSSQAAWSHGEWKLSAIYDELAHGPGNSDADWQAKIAQMKDWIKQKPESVVAQISLAATYYAGAMQARGTGYIDTVTEQGAISMEERVKQAHKALAAVSAQRKGYPEWYQVASDVARLGAISRPRYEELLNEGMRLFPAYHELPIKHVYYLLPRWYGEEGEWERYATRAANLIGGKKGDTLYAQIIWDFAMYRNFFELIAGAHPSWPREKRGWQALSELYPDNLRVASIYALRSSQNDDMATARLLFQTVIKNRVAADVWESPQAFAKLRTRVFAEPKKSKAATSK